MLSTRFTELVGCTVPLQQAPMGLLTPPRLALEVARAGAVGSVSAPLGVGPQELTAQLDRWVDADAGALAVNFITEQVDPAAVAVAGTRVRMVDFFWSTPHAKLVDAAHEGGALVNWQVGSLPDAVLAAEAGVDVVTVQGRDAGGHVRGDTPLLPLLAAVLRAVDVPVLAAGWDRRATGDGRRARGRSGRGPDRHPVHRGVGVRGAPRVRPRAARRRPGEHRDHRRLRGVPDVRHAPAGAGAALGDRGRRRAGRRRRWGPWRRRTASSRSRRAPGYHRTRT